MGRVLRALYQRKYRKKRAALDHMLAQCDDVAFLQLAWAVNTLQSDKDIDVRPYLRFPPEAATTSVRDQYSIHKWDIETLITLLFSTSNAMRRRGDAVQYRYDEFATLSRAVNFLRDAENCESGFILNGSNILMEMHRIGHRQFGWQRGIATTERLYRFAYVYTQGGCADYFEEINDLSIHEFLKVGFLLYAQLHHFPWSSPAAVKELGVDMPLIEKCLPLFSRSLTEIRKEALALIEDAKNRGHTRIAYLPSPLRQFPIVTDPASKKYIAPLPQLVMFRMTAGLYYDIRGGPASLITEANRRFEQYAQLVLESFFPRFIVLPSQRYGPKKARADSPDILIKDGASITAVVECKASKLTYEAQFSENPMEDAHQGYGQLVKGITQIWKFFSHARRGIFSEIPVADGAFGIVLTMDSWMQASKELQQGALDMARDALQETPDVTEADMRPIVFCSMQELSDIMFVSNEDQFLTTLKNASLEKYAGWPLMQVRRETDGELLSREFPLDIGELLPWWDQLYNNSELSA